MNELIPYISTAVSVLTLIVLMRKLNGTPEKRDVGPQPFVVKEHVEFVTQDHVREIKQSIESIDIRMEAMKKDLSESRRRIYATANTHSNALHFIAGRLAGKGDADADRLRAILKRAEEIETE